MLNSFPSLLMYSFFTPTLLRIATAVCLIYMAQHLVHTREDIANTSLPIIGKPHVWLVYLSAGLTLVVAFMLFSGLKLQWAAIGGALVSLKHAWYLRKYPAIRPFSTSTYLLISVICATLLLTGAGAIAFDLPL